MKTNRINSTLKRAALYARVSTEEQAQRGMSLDAQRERLIQYAKENELIIVDLYIDEGISARKRYTKRPEFIRMLEDIKAQKIDVVLFIKLVRWFRNIADYYEVHSILDKNNVQWIATEEDYDTTTANGRLALNIKLAIAQDESDRTSERIKFVFSNMVKEGKVISGKTPLGYEIMDKKAVINEEDAVIVKDMFQKYIDLRSIKATSRYILNKYGKSIDAKSMKHMLQNRWYIGEAYGIENWCPAIIDKNTFDVVSSIINVRSARHDGCRSDRVYLFTGLVFCASCGRRMTTYACHNKNKDGTVKQTFIYYRCPAHTMHLCDMSRQFNQDKLEEWLSTNLLSEIEKINLSFQTKKALSPPKHTDTSKIYAKIEKLKDLYLNDLLPKEMYEKEYTTLMSALKEAINEQKESRLEPIDPNKFKNFHLSYRTLTPTAKKAFWSRTLSKIFISENGEISIIFN